MSEITKLYENAGVAPKRCSECDNNMDCGFGKDCYPPFTAEKQIELIKWLGKWDYTVRIDFHENEWGIATEYHSGDFRDNLSEALASIINYLWQDLTEEEKQQVKRILE